jgi:hypothetical protein
LPGPSGEFFDNTGSLASSFLLTVLKTLQSVRAFVSGNDGETFLHFEVDGVDFENAVSDDGVEDEEAFFEGRGAFFDSVPDNLFDPHLDGFPPAEPGEEVEFLNIFIGGFFLKPVLQIDELNRLSPDVMTEALLADGVILKIGFLVFGLYLLVVDDFQLVDVVRVGGG